MKLLLDMNISPRWIEPLNNAGFDAVHWSVVGPPDAADTVLLEWARQHDYVVFTHDLDFGAILAATGANAPSVIQLRDQDLDPRRAASFVVESLVRFRQQLEAGALISIDRSKSRARVLPLD
jgi:predicted nuclease of predicted toxin-antitoxin system